MNDLTFSFDLKATGMSLAGLMGIRRNAGLIRFLSITKYDRRTNHGPRVGKISFGLYILKWLITLLAFASSALPTMSIHDQNQPSEDSLKTGIKAMAYSQFRTLLRKLNISIYLFSDAMTGEARLLEFEDQMKVMILDWPDVWKAYKEVITPSDPPSVVRISGAERSVKSKHPQCMEAIEFIKDSHKLLTKALESFARLTTGCVPVNSQHDASPPH